MKSYLFFILTVVHYFFCHSFAQGLSTGMPPEIGKKIPEFTLENTGNYSKRRVSSEDFKGRFVILDFWNKGCVSCIESFPKLNEVHLKYRDKLDVVLVGTEEKGIQEMFSRFVSKQELKFAYAFNFPLYNAFVPRGAPHVVWINDRGVVVAITPGLDLTIKNIEAFLNGEPFVFRDRSHAAFATEQLSYDTQKPYLVDDNGGDDNNFIYRSLLGKYKAGSPAKAFTSSFTDGHLPIVGERLLFEGVVNLKAMYKMAYLGRREWSYQDSIYNVMHGNIVLELSDSSLFVSNWKTGEGYYWYSLIAPASKVTQTSIMRSMQNDLFEYFGFDVRIEKRKFPCLKLRATPELKTKLKSKGGHELEEYDYSMYRGVNIPMRSFLIQVVGLLAFNPKYPVLIDETGIDSNIDVDIAVNNSDWADIQRALRTMGFTLVQEEREFKVMIISDKKDL